MSGDSRVWMPPPPPRALRSFILHRKGSQTPQGPKIWREGWDWGSGLGSDGGGCEKASRARPRLRTWRRSCLAAGPRAGPATPRARATRTGKCSVPQTVDIIKHLLCARRLDTARGQSCVPHPRAWPSTAQPSPWHPVEMQPRLPETPDSPTASQRGLPCLSHPVTRLLACWGPQCAGPERRDH